MTYKGPKHKKPLWLRILLVILLLGMIACLWEFVSSKNPYILPVKRTIKYDLLHVSPVNEKLENGGLNPSLNTFPTLYVNGTASADGNYVPGADNKRVIQTAEGVRLVNYLDGYQMDFPADAQFDFSLSSFYTRAYGDGWDAVVSREKATYEGMKDVVTFELSTFLPGLVNSDGVLHHINHYELRFLTDPVWQENNRVLVSQADCRQGNRLTAQFLAADLRDPGDAECMHYYYAFIHTGSREYLRVAVRCRDAQAAAYWGENWFSRGALPDGFRTFDPTGVGHCETDFYPDYTPTALSPETQKLYDELTNGDTLKWGIFTSDAYENLGNSSMEKLESELGRPFDAALVYRHFTHSFPTEFMEGNYQAGRVVELTYQTTTNNNEDMTAHTPFLDLYRGECDDEIRAFARDAAAWGHPFLFRLDNEMNSDWTSYSGVVNLSDPQLYIAVWQRIYRIFQEEGVNNCLWIYNPNDRNAPPCKWNDSLAYYPGNEYVHLLGVTGYNNGTYYTKWNEQWRDFKTIYDEIWNLYSPHFSRFPWIITEFASSSYGGDKAAWIDEMFAHIGDYPNIKLAVWFSAADYDGDTPARPYWLDETPETLAAFKRGFSKK